MKTDRMLFLALLAMPLLTGCSQEPTTSPEAVIEVTPSHAEDADVRHQAQAYANEGGEALRAGRLTEGTDLARKAVELRPQVAEYRIGLAIAYFHLKEDEKAEAELNQALPLLEKGRKANPRLVGDQAFVLVLLGRDEDAEHLLESPEAEALVKPFGGKAKFLENFKQMRERRSTLFSHP